MRYSTLFLVAATLVLACGCSGTRRPIETWKREVTRFVVVEGNGDPSCLRDTTDLRSRRKGRPASLTVSSIGAPGSTAPDARGVLVGQHEVNGRPWYIFLLAVVDFNGGHGSEVQSVRPVGLTADADGLHWFIPRGEDRTPPSYLESSGRQKQMLATSYAAFPGPKDVFEMKAAGPNVTITERASGAAWSLHLPASLRDTKEARLGRDAIASHRSASPE